MNIQRIIPGFDTSLHIIQALLVLSIGAFLLSPPARNLDGIQQPLVDLASDMRADASFLFGKADAVVGEYRACFAEVNTTQSRPISVVPSQVNSGMSGPVMSQMGGTKSFTASSPGQDSGC